jgi:hypothetical protein
VLRETWLKVVNLLGSEGLVIAIAAALSCSPEWIT